MKSFLLSLSASILSISSFAQKIPDLEPTVKAKFPFKIEFKFNDFNYDLSHIYGENGKEVALMDLNSGTPIWHIKAKELGVKDEIYLNLKRPGHCEIKTRGQNPKSFLVDTKSGKLIENEKDSWFGKLSLAEQSNLEARQEELFQASRTQEGDNFMQFDCPSCGRKEAEWNNLKLELDYPSESKTSGFGSKKEISVTATRPDKSKAWKVAFKGEIVRPLCYDFANSGSLFGKNQVSLQIVGDKALVMFEGLACIDLNEGKLLWQTDLENADLSIGLKAKQILGMAGRPLIAGNSLIIADLTKGNRTIKKIDLNSGQVIWASEKLKSDDVVPQIHQSGNLVICQIGGQIERQEFITGPSGYSASTCKAFQYLTEDNDLMALDLESGKTIWRAKDQFKAYKDKFEKLAISRVVNGQLVVLTDENVLLLNLQTGSLIKKLAFKELRVGELRNAVVMPDGDLFINATEGVARVSPQAEKKYAINTGANLHIKTERKGIIRVFTDNSSATNNYNEFVLMDSANGEVFGKVEDIPFPYFDSDMTCFIAFDGKATIEKYQFRKK
jgi:outer membrane protein assembly factor BamB